MMVVVIDVAHESPFEVDHVLEFLEVEELGIEHSEEALDGRVVEIVVLLAWRPVPQVSPVRM